MTTPIIELKGVARQFSGQDCPALEGVHLSIERGEFVAIVGQSGAGKSTLLNVLGLLDSPSEGNYAINGVETAGLAERDRDAIRARTFGFVFQDSFVLPSESVARNVALPLRMNSVKRERQRRLVTDVLDRFGLVAKSDQVAGTLSGGERQRVAFARAIAHTPLVLLADEPTGNLDSLNSQRVLQYLEELSRSGVTIIVITHSETVANVARRRIRLIDGKVAEDDSSAEIQEPASSASETMRPLDSHFGDDAARQRRPGSWHFAEALTALLLTPLRTLAILAAFVVAVGGLVTAVNMTATAADQVSATLSAAALDEVLVTVDGQPLLGAAQERILRLEGVQGVGSSVQIAPVDAQISRPVGPEEVRADADARAVDSAYFGVYGVEVWPQQASSLMAFEDGTPTAILGPDLAATLGISTHHTGDIITIAGQRVVVVGVITAAERDPTISNAALVSQADFVAPPGSVFGLTVRTEPGLPAKIAEAIPLAVDPGQPENVRVQTVADLRELTKGVNGDLAVNLLLTASVLLVLVCLTSAISMFLTVLARTREIALRRAVGATRRDIRLLFLAEGALIGLAGGLAGASLGLAATTALSSGLRWAPTFDVAGAALAVVAGVVAGAISAIIPARRAALVEPAIALRSSS